MPEMTIKTFYAIPLWMLILLQYSATATAQDDASSAIDTASMANGMTAVLARIDTSAVPLADFPQAFKRQTLYVAVDLPFSTTQPVVRIYCREAVPQGIELLRNLFDVGIGEPVSENGLVRYEISLGPNLDGDNRTASDLLPPASPDLAAALSAAGAAPFVAAISLPDYFKQLYSDLVPRLPEALGGGETAVLLRDVRWTAVAVDLQSASLTVEVKTVSKEAAERFAEQAPQAFVALVTNLGKSDSLRPFQQAGQLAIDGDRVRVQTDLQAAGPLLRSLAEGIAELQTRRREMTTLKQLAVAIHNYYDRYRSFPPDAEGRDEQGQPRLSWRVHLLPFIGEEKLYREFRLDEPWDSQHNRRLIERMPALYAWPGVEPGKTVIQAPVGEKTIFGQQRPTTFRDITDGTSNTAMMVITQPRHAVTWTAPDDYRFNPERPAEGLATDRAGTAAVAMGDSSAQRIAVDLPGETWLHLFQMNDGHAIRW